MAKQLNMRRLAAALLVTAIFLLAACGGGAAAPTGDAGTGDAAAGTETETTADTTCPEPNPKMEVTSKELNLFVWTEYIPQQTIDCFEQVYGITVNHSEYSSNEEM